MTSTNRTLSNATDAAYHAEKGQLKHFGLILRYVKPLWPWVAGALGALIITSSAVLGMGWGVRYLIDEGFANNNAALLDQALILLFTITAILAAATYGRFYCVNYVGEHIVARLRQDVYNHVITLSPGFFETTRTGEILSRLTTDTTLLQAVVGGGISIALRNLLLFIGGAILLAITSPVLTGYIALIVPLIIIMIITLGRKVKGLSRLSQDKVADLAAHTEETISGIKTVQSYARESLESQHFATHAIDALNAAMRRVRIRALLIAIVIMAIFGAIGFVLWMGGHRVLNNTMSAGELTSFIFYAMVVAGAVGAISEVMTDLQRAAGATERLFELMAIPSPVASPTRPATLTTPVKGAIQFDHISFHYPATPETASLEDISLTIDSGETIALVGPSGAGKSTLLQLLTRFYDPSSGHITIDGVDIRHLALSELRQLFGFVSQESVIFSGTAAENIRYGRPEASDSEVIAAAKAAACDSFISTLPQGYDTYLGEKGVRLSGGQKQRIAIARAILKDPAILLLDEATSSLDAANEQSVQHALEELMQQRTTLIIAHRLSTVINAKRIIVIDNGHIHAIGNHQELLTHNPLYAKLAKLQFQDQKITESLQHENIL